MVEFVIVAPLLILLVLGIVELGHALYQHNILTKAVAVGARYVARGYTIIDTNCVKQTGWSSVETVAKNLIVYGNTDTGEPSDALLPNLDAAGIIITALSLDPHENGVCVINVYAETEYAPLFGRLFEGIQLPFIGEVKFLDFMLNAASQERYIGE